MNNNQNKWGIVAFAMVVGIAILSGNAKTFLVWVWWFSVIVMVLYIIIKVVTKIFDDAKKEGEKYEQY